MIQWLDEEDIKLLQNSCLERIEVESGKVLWNIEDASNGMVRGRKKNPVMIHLKILNFFWRQSIGCGRVWQHHDHEGEDA